MKNGSIRGVLAVIYAIVMSASLIVGLGIYQGITSSNREAKAYVQKLQNTKSLEYMLNLAVEKTVDNSLEITLDKRLNNLLVNGIKLTDDEVSAMIDTWLINNEEASSVHIVNLKKDVLSKSKVSTYSLSQQQFLSQFSQETLEAIDDKGGECYFGIADNMLNGMAAGKIYLARRINSLEKLDKIGYIFVFFDAQVLMDKVSQYMDSKGMQVILADEDGNFINFYKGAVLGEMYKAYKYGSMTEAKSQEWEADFHHVELEDDQLQLMLITDMSQTTMDDNIINIVIAILIINLVFLTIGTFVIKKAVVYPLEKIASKARRITGEADLSIRFDQCSTYAEAGLIVNVLNEMLERIDALIKENKEKEKQRRILELSVVNHQVNPHFLFNTLNSVNVLIAMEDKATALKLVASLARYYRACLSQEETINTIEQEIKVTKEYINIMQLKNPGMIQAEFDVEEKLNACKVPGMILQTLVENCIKYGIRTMDESLIIHITIREEADKGRIALVVKDNGRGMEPEVCGKLLNEEKIKGKSGFGLRGTIKRIRLMYNVKATSDILKIDSRLNEYTEITIYIPTH